MNIERLERESSKWWNIFYKHNQGNFFKDRNYITLEFTELLKSAEKVNPVLLDCGCGAGNAFFPLFEQIPNLTVNAFDFSSVAVELVKVTLHIR